MQMAIRVILGVLFFGGILYLSPRSGDPNWVRPVSEGVALVGTMLCAAGVVWTLVWKRPYMLDVLQHGREHADLVHGGPEPTDTASPAPCPPDAMTREEMVSYAESLGWKAWGNLKKRPHDDSFYQAFRRKNDYIWIGHAFVERTGYAVAKDFRHQAQDAKGLVA